MYERWYSNLQLILLKKDELGLEKPTNLSVLEQRGTLHILDKLIFSVSI